MGKVCRASLVAIVLILTYANVCQAEPTRRRLLGTNGLLADALSAGHLPQAMHWLRFGADLDVDGTDGTTALMLAAERSDIAVVRWLLCEGALIDAQDNQRRTALMRGRRNPEIVDCLVAWGADTRVRDRWGHSVEFYRTRTWPEWRIEPIDPEPGARISVYEIARRYSGQLCGLGADLILRRSSRRMSPIDRTFAK